MNFLITLKNRHPFSFSKYSGYLLALVTFTLAFYLQYSIAFIGLDLHHDLLMFDAARNFYSGQAPYKDFFYQYNLATLFLHSASLGLFGLKIISLKKITVLFYALIALLIYLSCAIEGNKRAGFLLSILWALLSPFYMPALNGYHAWSTIYMMFSCMTGLVCFQLAIQKKLFIFSFAAGVFFGLAFWFKQVAAYQIIAVIFWLILSILFAFRNGTLRHRYIKIFSGYALGGFIISLPFITYLYLESGILNWWIDAFVFNSYFAKDSQPITTLVGLGKIMFPISRDLGYQSFFWAICPLALLVILSLYLIHRNKFFRFSLTKREILLLFLVVGFAGWIEYFPLPHPFHTQLFMAPTFVVVGILFGNYSVRFDLLKKYPALLLFSLLFIIFGSYDAIRHLQGFYQKMQNTKQFEVSRLNPVFANLKLHHRELISLENFYLKVQERQTLNSPEEFIPISVDPMRGLLPGIISKSNEFKMGVNWGWPNLIIEPEFIAKLDSKISQRKQSVFADSLIFIPGYLPTALLEMRSPITNYHFLYEPTKIYSKLIFKDIYRSDIIFANNNNFDLISKSVLFPWDNLNKYINLLPIDGLSDDDIKNIENIHISIIDEKEFPSKLSPLRLGYLDSNDKYFGSMLSHLYIGKEDGWFEIAENLSCENKKNIAYFMLTNGKLFESQNKPLFLSTLLNLKTDMPFLTSIGKNQDILHYVWSKNASKIGSHLNFEKKQKNPIYLGFRNIINLEISTFFIIQIEMRNGVARSHFYSICNSR